MKSVIGDKRGFSLVELVVSILIFSLGFLGVTKMQQQAVMGNSFGMQMTNAVNIIDSQTEYFRGLSFPNDDLDVDHVVTPIKITRQGIEYELSWVVSDTPLGASENARQIDVTVKWNEKLIPHTITMSMFKSS